jgi:excisionase family DNA binding protein
MPVDDLYCSSGSSPPRGRGPAIRGNREPALSGPWLDVAKAAEYLALTKRALYQAVRRGTIPAHRLADTNRLRFSQPELDAMFNNPSGRAS